MGHPLWRGGEKKPVLCWGNARFSTNKSRASVIMRFLGAARTNRGLKSHRVSHIAGVGKRAADADRG